MKLADLLAVWKKNANGFNAKDAMNCLMHYVQFSRDYILTNVGVYGSKSYSLSYFLYTENLGQTIKLNILQSNNFLKLWKH